MTKAGTGSRFGAFFIDYICRVFVIGILVDLFGFRKGSTIGRRTVNIKVVDEQGNDASFLLMLVRTILK